MSDQKYMSKSDAIDILRRHNEWRRGVTDGPPPVNPKKIGEAIDVVVSAKNIRDDKVAQAFCDIVWMAIRYANGRQTYAPGLVRHAIKTFRQVYPGWFPVEDSTLKLARRLRSNTQKPFPGWKPRSDHMRRRVEERKAGLEDDWLDDLVN